MSPGDTNSKKDDGRRDSMITVRVSESERATIESAAEEAGRSVSAHLRASASAAAGGVPAARVPELNRRAWVELAGLAANLNQLARRANQLAAEPGESGPSAVEVFEGVGRELGELRGRVSDLRRSLLGASALEDAAELLSGYRRGARLGSVAADAEELAGVAARLRELAVELGEGGL
jgi:uncharacterized protein (DUF1778 family)